MSPEKIEEAKQAVALHKAQEELRKQGLLPEEGEGEEDEGDEWEVWFDRVITRVAIGVAGVAVLVGVVISVVGLA